jgi:hypothetical protein
MSTERIAEHAAYPIDFKKLGHNGFEAQQRHCHSCALQYTAGPGDNTRGKDFLNNEADF